MVINLLFALYPQQFFYWGRPNDFETSMDYWSDYLHLPKPEPEAKPK
jgi:hypothetical protein